MNDGNTIVWQPFDYMKDGLSPFDMPDHSHGGMNSIFPSHHQCKKCRGLNIGDNQILVLMDDMKVYPAHVVTIKNGTNETNEIYAGYGVEPEVLNPHKIIATLQIHISEPTKQIIQEASTHIRPYVLQEEDGTTLGEFYLGDLDSHKLLDVGCYSPEDIEHHYIEEACGYGAPFTIEGDSLRFTNGLEDESFLAERILGSSTRRIYVGIISYEEYTARQYRLEQQQQLQRSHDEKARANINQKNKIKRTLSEQQILFASSKCWRVFERHNSNGEIENFREKLSQSIERIHAHRFSGEVSKLVVERSLSMDDAIYMAQQKMENNIEKMILKFVHEIKMKGVTQ